MTQDAINGSPQTENLDIGYAVFYMRSGQKVQREGWNGKGMWLKIAEPKEITEPTDTTGIMTEPFVYMYTAQGTLIPWLASQADLLARDWRVV